MLSASQRTLSFRPSSLLIVVSVVLSGVLQSAVAQEEVPLKLPQGFQATLYADDKLASNIQCITTDPQGRIVVSGPGYIKTLLDEDGDGVAESAKIFAEEPASGAQGLCYDQDRLYCVGGQGVLAFTDENQDGVADAAPELKFRCRTGGEHYAHAIRKGPDGWWYLIAGNNTNIDHQLLKSETSPITKPQAGELLRFSPNFSKLQVLCDGYRNA